MANKPLKSIKYPGLPDTYTFVQIGTEAGQAADAGAFGNLKSVVNKMELASFDDISRRNGMIASTGKWSYVTSPNYLHVIIPINSGDVIGLKNSSLSVGVLYYGVLTEYGAPVNDASIPYSAQEGFTNRRTLSVGSNFIFTAPSDAKYLLIQTKTSSGNYYLDYLEINGMNIVESANRRINELYKGISTAVTLDDIRDGFLVNGIAWESGTYQNIVGSQMTKVVSVTRQRTFSVLQFDYPIIIKTDGTYSYYIRFVDENGIITEAGSVSRTTDTKIPARQRFAIVIALASDKTANLSELTPTEINNHIRLGYYELADIINSVNETSLNWIAMGDSITQGWYSAFDGDGGAGSAHVDATKTWASKCASLNKWNLTNKGIGGTGWLHKGNNNDLNNAFEEADTIDFTAYDVVTLAYGINDWKGNKTIGSLSDDITTPSTVIAAMKKTIETIIASNPTIKIFIITPLNCVGYNYAYGTEESNWALSYEFANSGTLETFVQDMISVCNYYGIQYIDQTHYSVVNRKNLLACLPDGVHPSEDTHTALAHELAGKINVL